MKRRPIIILLFLTHALLKIVTFQDAMKKANFIRSFGAAGMFHEYLKVQLEQGSCDEATEALLSYERMLEQFKDRDGALILGGLSSFDRVSTHVRLAKIVRKPESKVVIVSALQSTYRLPEKLARRQSGLTVLNHPSWTKL